jgi:phosphoribosylformylglycinamidine synthase subunit PurQ / glutaminase
MVPRNELVATLTHNTNGKFESRWIELKSQESESKYVKKGDLITLPVDHGEGKLIASDAVIAQIEHQGQVVYRYSDTLGNATQEYPDNPNGSTNAIAGITDQSGVIFGMMPHVEDFVRPEHHPNWRRNGIGEKPHGLAFFEQVVAYVSEK